MVDIKSSRHNCLKMNKAKNKQSTLNIEGFDGVGVVFRGYQIFTVCHNCLKMSKGL